MAALIAGALILAQGAAVWAFLRFVKSFGDYTESQRGMVKALLEINESNLAVHSSNVKLLERIEAQQYALEQSQRKELGAA